MIDLIKRKKYKGYQGKFLGWKRSKKIVSKTTIL